MRKVISLMMVLVLGVAVMGTSAYGVCPGPNAVSATMTDGSPTPSGDDGAWNDPATAPRATGPIILQWPFLSHSFYGTIVLAYFTVIGDYQDNETSDWHDENNLEADQRTDR